MRSASNDASSSSMGRSILVGGALGVALDIAVGSLLLIGVGGTNGDDPGVGAARI